MTTKSVWDMSDLEFDAAIRAFSHSEHLARGAAETERFLVEHGLKEATPPKPPADLPNAKPFDAQTDAYLRRQFPDHAKYQLTKYGLKESK